MKTTDTKNGIMGWSKLSTIMVASLILSATPSLGQKASDSMLSVNIATIAPKKSWWNSLFERPTLLQAITNAATPRDFSRAISKNISYRPDRGDIHSPPESTWSRGRGDCEDFAMLMMEYCRLNEIDATMYFFFSSDNMGEGHAVVVGTWEGKLWLDDLGDYSEIKSLDEVRERVARGLNSSAQSLWHAKIDMPHYNDKLATLLAHK